MNTVWRMKPSTRCAATTSALGDYRQGTNHIRIQNGHIVQATATPCRVSGDEPQSNPPGEESEAEGIVIEGRYGHLPTSVPCYSPSCGEEQYRNVLTNIGTECNVIIILVARSERAGDRDGPLDRSSNSALSASLTLLEVIALVLKILIRIPCLFEGTQRAVRFPTSGCRH